MKQEDRFSANIAGKEQKNYTLLKKGELAYNHGNSKLAKFGAVFELKDFDEALVPRVYHSFRVNNKTNSSFIEYMFATKLPDKELGKLVSSGARMDGLLNIGYEDFVGINITVPSLEEQQKIAYHFRKLDEVITLHQRKPKLLCSSQNFYLVSEYAHPWEQRKLKEIACKVKNKNKENAISETFTNSAEFGIISQKEFFDHEVASKTNLDSYYIVDIDDFVYNPRISVTAPVGPINRNKLGKAGVMSPLYTVFKTQGVSIDFLEHYFKSTNWHSYMYLNGDSGARSDRFSIKDDVFFDMPIMVPCIKEQMQIGLLFNAISKNITLHQR